MKLTKEQAKFKNRTTWAYVGFIFQTFFKRPFGYIIAALYVLYLAIILLIVPAGVHLDPLFIWSNAAFNMPIFNLFFIAAASGALAVAVFRTGRDDGTELTLSSKPITKNIRIFGKVFVYLAIMLGFTAIIIALAALIYPVFGEYNLWTNINGITMENYKGLLLSLLIGNIVNMLLFGGISVLISMVGGQVITIIASVGIAFLMVLLNVIFPIAVSSPLDVLHNKYNTSINSMVANTRGQYENNAENSKVKNFAAIQCITEESGEEVSHFDTYEYWTKANRESGIKATNYVDFGKQLSYLFSAFGVDSVKLEAASKLMIGANNTNYYNIIQSTHVSSKENIEAKNYPFCIYTLSSKQGISYPIIYLNAGDLDIDTTNWYATTTLYKADWNAAIVASTSPTKISSNSEFRNALGISWFKMSDLLLNEQQKQEATAMFYVLMSCTKYDKYSEYTDSEESAISVIINSPHESFWTGEYEKLPILEKFRICSMIQLYWLQLAQDWQIDRIDAYCDIAGIDDHFPFKSKTVKDWYESTVVSPTGEHLSLFYKQKQIENIYGDKAINAGNINASIINVYPRIATKHLEYCETFNNLYEYNVKSFYDVNVLITIWTIISAGLFTTSIIIYKRTDFK